MVPTPSSSVWHAGERALQARVGIDSRMAEFGARVIRDRMPEVHRAFFAQLPFVIAGGLDAAGQPWAGAMAGPPGFVRSPDARHLRIDAWPAADDPLAASIRPGAAMGLLGIEPHTQRRNRLNGRVQAVDDAGFSLVVGQSFGNCPKYIHPRRATFAADAAGMAALGPDRAIASVRPMASLDDASRRLVETADTFFIATAHPQAARSSPAATPAEGVDVSHRGGPAGFVRVDADGTLQVPDYPGNQFFNTLGNLALDARAGLLFVDFERGDLLQVAGRAEVIWNGPAVDAVPGAQRMLRLQVTAVRHAPAALALRWTPAED